MLRCLCHACGQHRQGDDPQLVSTGLETTAPNNDNNKVTLQLPPLTSATLAVIRVKVPHMLINESVTAYFSFILSFLSVCFLSGTFLVCFYATLMF